MPQLFGHQANEQDNALSIDATGEPSHGGAYHDYLIVNNDGSDKVVGSIHFQEGPIKEHGINGVTEAALLEIVLHRLRAFQAGPFSSRDNSLAITHIEDGLMRLHNRTRDRQRRKVEGESKQ